MKFVAISDTHTRDIPAILKGIEADVLLIAGDWSSTGSLKNIFQFKQYLKAVRSQFTRIVWINGNHEIGLMENPHLNQEIAEETDTNYLEDNYIMLPRMKQKSCNRPDFGNVENPDDYITIFGSPYTPEFYRWAYMYPRKTDRWKKYLYKPADIVMTHGPAYKILDLTPERYGPPEHVGCWDLRQQIEVLKPKVHVFGHLHCSHGAKLMKWEDGRDTYFYNVAICDEDYLPSNRITEFTLR